MEFRLRRNFDRHIFPDVERGTQGMNQACKGMKYSVKDELHILWRCFESKYSSLDPIGCLSLILRGGCFEASDEHLRVAEPWLVRNPAKESQWSGLRIHPRCFEVWDWIRHSEVSRSWSAKAKIHLLTWEINSLLPSACSASTCRGRIQIDRQVREQGRIPPPRMCDYFF